MKIKYVWTLLSAEKWILLLFITFIVIVISFFFQSIYDLEHLALKLDMNFFSLPFDAVNIYLVTMISEYVCSCDNIILKKRKTCKAWQWSREMTKNNMKYELKQKKSYWKLIQTQQEFLVKIISFSPIWH